MSPARRAGLVALVLATLSPPRAHAVVCPAGEITLASSLVKAARKGAGEDGLASPKNTLVVPVGSAVDPGTEPLEYALSADAEPLHALALPAGSLVANAAGTRFVHRVPGARLVLRRIDAGFRVDVNLRRLDLAGLDLASPPLRVKQVLKLGDDCFSAILACAVERGKLVCRPERSALLRGKVARGRTPLAGAMVTAFDDARFESVSVFTLENGRYVFPPLRPGTWRVRARRLGYADGIAPAVTLVTGKVTKLDFALTAVANDNGHLSGVHFLALLLDRWPDPIIRGDFTLSCGNCHTIGGWRFRRDKTDAEWATAITRMLTFLPPYFQATRDLIPEVLPDVLGTDPPLPALPLPPPPTGDVLRAVVYEYGLGDATARPGCHDLELGTDGVVYADAGVRWIDPRTGVRGTYPLNGGAHSIERGPDGNMWITQADEDVLAKLDVTTHEFTYYPLPRIGDDQGAYPHTLRFDAQGRIWFTLTKSNHVAVFDPATEAFTYHRLPPADAAEVGLSIPVAYGCDTAPDGTVWFSQLFGQRIGRIDPTTGALRAWRPPFLGPRRLHADADGIVWVPGYASGVLGRFDPATERWKVWNLPTGLPGPPGFGTSETPYSLNANRQNGEVWVNGSNSDTLIRFEPGHERFTAFPLPTLASFTREIEFDPDNNVWTCTSNEPAGPEEPGRGKFVKVELPPPGARCGNARLESGEECDDGNAVDCDACSNGCRRVEGCGDGALCGTEPCDDGNTDDCDGCSATCVPEAGLRCGDGIVNAACGEACDPPGTLCSAQCQRLPGCGDGIEDPGEGCDDGNVASCDGCSATCTTETGCGDGAVCGAEACDDGNAAACDGCSPTCTVESGYVCGDGIQNPACGEECDPPGPGAPECSYRCRLGAAPPLGTRHLSISGSAYSSALGVAVPLGLLAGSLDLEAGAPGFDGIAPVSVTGPVYLRAPILGGAFGNLCFRVTSCTGIVDCNGGTAVGVEIAADSGGPGVQGNPVTTTTGLGPDGGPGAVLLTCQQSFVQVGPTQTDCAAVAYSPDAAVAHTSGTASAAWLNADLEIGTGQITVAGERFACEAWSTENGPGKLAATFLVEADPQAGDTANAIVIDD
jgi:cysteine-rich repeat protein